jgi:hypothetical protein
MPGEPTNLTSPVPDFLWRDTDTIIPAIKRTQTPRTIAVVAIMETVSVSESLEGRAPNNINVKNLVVSYSAGHYQNSI